MFDCDSALFCHCSRFSLKLTLESSISDDSFLASPSSLLFSSLISQSERVLLNADALLMIILCCDWLMFIVVRCEITVSSCVQSVLLCNKRNAENVEGQTDEPQSGKCVIKVIIQFMSRTIFKHIF